MKKGFFLRIIVIVANFSTICGNCACRGIERSELKKLEQRSYSIANTFISDSCKKNMFTLFCPKPLISSSKHEEIIKVESGDYLIGNSEPNLKSDNELELKLVHVNKFFIDQYEVSNAKFSEFIKATKYVTQAEKYGDSFVFVGILSEFSRNNHSNNRVRNAPWWYKVKNASWKHPEGDGSTIIDRMNHPVVHVSWFDASAYCKWKKMRLPNEIEWEVACRGGKKNKLFPWGNKLKPRSQHWLNIWQGEFPTVNTAEDGYFATCPVDRFKQNDFNLYNMVGNVWEWTDSTWDQKTVLWNDTAWKTIEKVKKGGSYLCHKSYCYRYRCGARSSNTANSSSGNLGFRCAYS